MFARVRKNTPTAIPRKTRTTGTTVRSAAASPRATVAIANAPKANSSGSIAPATTTPPITSSTIAVTFVPKPGERRFSSSWKRCTARRSTGSNSGRASKGNVRCCGAEVLTHANVARGRCGSAQPQAGASGPHGRVFTFRFFSSTAFS
ncbi:hypothetical protein [Microbacterium sp. JZ31]|uniref:hypothetical protein n=1 Tax=Microbacterium sp. JZ31 TaxID=1906274 RepID=UPI00300D5022